ncbi:MAG TPA: poly-beta-1,6 N-acetyl-D-glucosamine synthase, partial [Pseudoxanthomonas sp.]|nr:poly-beta-1,6 N-acetyl-D-glucosamine synthase [Pseudoxanthomonas sp.]
YTMLLMMGVSILHSLGVGAWVGLPSIGFLPGEFGAILAVHYLMQALIAAALDRRYEVGIMRTLFWVVWYPLVFWVLQMATAVVGFPRALLHRSHTGRWTSPDRGLRK